MDKKISFVMNTSIVKKLDFLKETDKRSIQKELEWLIEHRYEELKK